MGSGQVHHVSLKLRVSFSLPVFPLRNLRLDLDLLHIRPFDTLCFYYYNHHSKSSNDAYAIMLQILTFSNHSHGRDNSLRVWQLRPSDEGTLSTVLPAEDATAQRPKPWLLHTLPVNTLNFCSFSMCIEHNPLDAEHRNISRSPKQAAVLSCGSILVATPSTDDKKINVYQLPDEKLRYVVPKALTTDTGK